MSASQVVFRQGPRIALRPLERSDIPQFVQWMNDQEVTRFLMYQLPIMLPMEEKWFERLCEKPEDNIVLGITLRGKLIGDVGLHRIDWIGRSAILGIAIGDKTKWGKGYGREAMILMLEYAFRCLNFRKISSMVYAPNIKSIRCHELCGFKREGLFKEHIFRDGKYSDEVRFGIFERDWLPAWQKFKKTGRI